MLALGYCVSPFLVSEEEKQESRILGRKTKLSPLEKLCTKQLTNAFLSQVSKKLSKEQIEAVFAKFDGNGDGKLSKEEFQQLMAAKK